MEAAAQALTAPRRPLTTTERNWLKALAIVVGSALLFFALQALEKRVGHADRAEAVVSHPLETPMRLMALAHFLVAIAFVTTSKAMRSASSWAWMVGLAAAGVGLCLLFGQAGGLNDRFARAVFYAYFLFHEFRDQAFFYEANGDIPRMGEPKQTRRDLLGIPWLTLGLIVSLFLAAAGLRLGGARRYEASFWGWVPETFRPFVALLPLLLVVVAAVRWHRRIARTHPGGMRAFLRTHRPMLLVFGGIVAVLLLDILVTHRAYAIVSLHVTAWYVFVIASFRRRPSPTPAPAPATWRWVRTTRSGFNVFHLGVLSLLIVGALVWAYGFRNDAALSAMNVVLSREAFPYWTIMHVTISWLPR